MRLLLFLAGLLAILLVTSSLASPVPKDKRTTEEKLIGKWELVKVGDHKHPVASGASITFNKDKTFSIEVTSKKRAPSFRKGYYGVEGNKLTLNTRATAL